MYGTLGFRAHLFSTVIFTETPTTAAAQGGMALYYYDGNGTMVKSVIGEVVTYYGSPAYQVKSDGTNGNTRKYYSFGNTTTAMRENDIVVWLMSDQVNSTTVTANADGTLASEIKYTAFGEMRSVNGVTVTDNRYTGQREEAELGLYYYVARWYDPALAHFIQADTIVPHPGFSLSYDRYAYVNFNPIRYSDPTGHYLSVEDSLFNGHTYKSNPLFKSPSYVPFKKDNELIAKLKPKVATAYIKSELPKEEFTTRLLEGEFYNIPNEVTDPKDIEDITKTGMNWFRSWRSNVKNTVGDVWADVLNWVGGGAMESGRNRVDLLNRGLSLPPLYGGGELEFAKEVLSAVVSHENISNTHIYDTDYITWGNETLLLEKYGILPDPDFSRSFLSGNEFYIITSAEMKRLDSLILNKGR